MKKVYVSGCFDLLHAGHIQFFKDAKALGDVLIVDFAGDDVLWRYKQRRSVMPESHKKMLLESIECVDKVYVSKGQSMAVPFAENFLAEKPDILAVTDDDTFEADKRILCNQAGCQYVKLTKRPPAENVDISTTSLIRRASRPKQIPLRIDFAGGWLDVPQYARQGAYVVNAAIDWFIGQDTIPCPAGSGLGGSAAWALLHGQDTITAEAANGAGWQDPAAIQETGLCVWQSGIRPRLVVKSNADWFTYTIGLYDTQIPHSTQSISAIDRDYDAIGHASLCAYNGVIRQSSTLMANAVDMAYQVQLDEGMQPLPDMGEVAKKYCGSGHGGYAMYLFDGQSPDTIKTVRIYTRGVYE
jgi:cytidyltransferase-like protein